MSRVFMLVFTFDTVHLDDSRRLERLLLALVVPKNQELQPAATYHGSTSFVVRSWTTLGHDDILFSRKLL